MNDKPFLLYPYQKRFFSDPSLYKIGLFARQSGKSYVASLELFLDVLSSALLGRGCRWLVLSSSLRQSEAFMAQHVLSRVETLLRFCDAFAREAHEHGSVFKEARRVLSLFKYRKNQIQMGQKAYIEALSSSPIAARGFEGHVLLDEFAFHRQDAAVWESVFPVVSAGRKLLVISTPNGRDNVFYRLSLSPKWSVHRCDIYQAVSEGLPRDLGSLRAALGDESAWQREYELSFEAAGRQAFSSEDLSACMRESSAEGASSCFVGVDIARVADNFVIWVLGETSDGLSTLEVICERSVSFLTQERLLLEVIRKYRVAKVHMDQSGMGEKPVEDARRAFGRRVEGVRFSAPLKRRLVIQMREALKARRIQLPNTPEVMHAFSSVEEWPHAEFGSVFKTKRDRFGHGDLAWAAMLALNAALGEKGSGALQGLELIRSSFVN